MLKPEDSGQRDHEVTENIEEQEGNESEVINDEPIFVNKKVKVYEDS